MKKIISFSVATILLFAASTVSAQSYNYGASTQGCTNISRDLSYGSRGGDVTNLQQFLVARNYPGSGSWMVTGYFGRATEAAVRNFQSEQRMAMTGHVDSTTRMAIDRVSCGAAYSHPNYIQNNYPQSPFNFNNGYPYTTPYVNLYPTPYFNYNNYNTYGYPFNYGNQYDNQYGCNSYYGSTGCCGYGNVCPLSLSYINPTSGGVGTSVTIVGTGFSTTGNTVRFGVGIIAGLTSPDGRSVSFTVPTQLSGYGSQIVTLGQYPVSVTNSSGATSNTLTYTVTSLGSSVAPIISSVSGPTTLSVNASGVWSLTVNNQGSTYATATVTWGDPVYGAYLAAPQQIYGNGTQTITFSHAYSQTGTFTITFRVTNQAGQSNTSSVTVNVTGNSSTGNVSLSSVSPTAGHVGTQVILTGSNFSTLDNTVHFGQGGTLHVPSQNGTTLYYTIPYAVSACDLIGYGCAAPTNLVSQGQYPIYITNNSGTSGTLYFTVQ